MEIPPEHFTAHDRRNQKVIRYGLCSLIILLGIYIFAAFMGWLPTAFRPNRQRIEMLPSDIENTFLVSSPQGVNPEPYLGVAYQGTRFRFVPSERAAVVIRPDKLDLTYEGRTSWIIPERVMYQGESFTVTALSATAFLYAEGMKSVTLPSTLRYFNGAEEILLPELETIILQRSHDTPLILTKEAFIAYVQAYYPQPQPKGEAPL